MRVLILADIHANWYALESVLTKAEGQYDEIVCCGDLVGYNTQPDRVVEWVKNNCRIVIRGNHDKVVAGLEDLEWFNEVARSAVIWTRENMQSRNLDFLRGLQHGPASSGMIEVCHGSPLDEDEYITNSFEAEHCFAALEGSLLFFGHSHLQGAFAHRRNTVLTLPAVKKPDDQSALQLELDTQYMVNPGSVGQPRDRDPRAAYAIYDSASKAVLFFRAAYDAQRMADEIKRAGLPDILAARLFLGV